MEVMEVQEEVLAGKEPVAEWVQPPQINVGRMDLPNYSPMSYF